MIRGKRGTFSLTSLESSLKSKDWLQNWTFLRKLSLNSLELCFEPAKIKNFVDLTCGWLGGGGGSGWLGCSG